MEKYIYIFSLQFVHFAKKNLKFQLFWNIITGIDSISQKHG